MRILFGMVVCLILNSSCKTRGSSNIRESINEEAEGPYGMVFVTIPAGKFMMGSPDNEFSRYQDEKQHEVIITRAFEMTKHEVTNAQWAPVARKTDGLVSKPSFFAGIDFPVEQVSWEDVQKFIITLNNGTKRCGDTRTVEGFKKAWSTAGCYRLPTEAEWEYATRGGTKTPFYTGDNIATDQANYKGIHPNKKLEDSNGLYRQRPVHVTWLDNTHPHGLMHVHGNVAEWTQDYYYNSYELLNLQDPMALLPDPDKSIYDRNRDKPNYDRVHRGGTWSLFKDFVRSASRDKGSEGLRRFDIGFRLVRTI